MIITKQDLIDMGVSKKNAEKYYLRLYVLTTSTGIETPLRLCHFLTQVLFESGNMRVVVENMNYSAERLLKIFPKHFDEKSAEQYARKPRMIANHVYANRLGNGDESSGDGYKYRGRGLIQLTGKTWYKKFSKWVGEPSVIEKPELLTTQCVILSAIYFWEIKNLNKWADEDNLKEITRRVNGSTRSVTERAKVLKKVKIVLGVE